MNGKFREFEGVVPFITLVATLILGVTLCIPLYMLMMVICHIPEQVHLSFQQTLHAYVQVVGEVLNPFAGAFEVPFFTTSQQAAHHFIDVRHWFTVVEIIVIFGMPYTFFTVRRQLREGWLYTWHMRLKQWLWYPLPLIIMLPVGFKPLFILFHQLIFTNNDWMFDVNVDPIIQLFPLPFFLACSVMVLGLYYGVIIYCIHYLKRKESCHERRN